MGDKDGLEFFVPFAIIGLLIGGLSCTAVLGGFFYTNNISFESMITESRILNIFIVLSVSFATFVGTAGAALVVAFAMMYGNSTPIWLKMLK